MDCKDFKKSVIKECGIVVDEKLKVLAKELDFLMKDISEDTKSSAGDKFETTREMVNAERQTLYARVEDLNKMSAALTTLPAGSPTHIDFGNLVQTDNNWLFIAVSLGAIEVANEKVLVISPVAPLGKLMLNKKAGDTVSFNSITYKIKNIC